MKLQLASTVANVVYIGELEIFQWTSERQIVLPKYNTVLWTQDCKKQIGVL